MPHFDRAAGVLLHITSLPGPYGIGDLGANAFHFVDFLHGSGQKIWQMLPMGPTVQCDSPYSCYSAFAGNPLLISMEKLVEEGFLPKANLRDVPVVAGSEHAVDYVAAKRIKVRSLRDAFARFRAGAASERVDDLEAFASLNRWWLDDFAMFAALMNHLGTDNWCSWPQELVERQPAALARVRIELEREIEFEQFVQYLFFRQWHQLKQYAASRRVKLFGDMPIFVAHGSADVWANQKLFWLEPSGCAKLVAGVPPDYFSKTGQLWGNPLYNWDALAETNYTWWVQRFRMAFNMYDMLRIDHFRAFEAYWEIPAKAKTAVGGKWVKGPGSAPFDAARQSLGELPIVAEDLGMITEEVHELRDQLQFPGMRVLQFGFDDANDNFHRPESYPADSAAYTGTHDNSTIVGWLNERAGRDGPDILADYLEDPTTSGMPNNWQLISMVLRSPSNTAIIPMQDIMGLDDSSRMNIPGQAIGNWRWRFLSAELTQDLVDRLQLLTVASDR